MTKSFKIKTIIAGAFAVGSFSVAYFVAPILTSVEYSPVVKKTEVEKKVVVKKIIKKVKPSFIVTHVKTPKAVKGIYMTSCVAATPSFRKKLVNLIKETELNSVVIDVKDYTGTISFKIDNPMFKDIKGTGCRAEYMKEFIGTLHKLGVYVIGRVTVFQDPNYTKRYPQLAVKEKNNKDIVWEDRNGISYVDPGAKKFWGYIVALSKDAYGIGFDEINYDYIRFPSDGNMENIYYPFSEKEVLTDPDFGRAKIIQSFAEYLNKNLSGMGIPLSADLFGYTTTNFDDLGIGQVLERTLPYFNYVMPMVYPSHYNSSFIGIKKPATEPYRVVNYSMKRAVKRVGEMIDADNSTSTTTKAVYLRNLARSGNNNISKYQLRPWIQDFNLGAIYTPAMVRSEIQATYDAGLTSWVLWDARNRYTKDALLEK